jgi:hypothetical protein
MDHLLLKRMIRASKLGLVMGAALSAGIFFVVRLIFWGFDFSWMEEIVNFVKITSIGGCMLSAAFVGFLFIENGIILAGSVKKNKCYRPVQARENNVKEIGSARILFGGRTVSQPVQTAPSAL